MKKSSLKKLRKYHKWPGLIISVFILFFAISGILMNHRHSISSFEVSRDYLPDFYKYINWNLAAVKGSVKSNDSIEILYGNIGIWELNTADSTFSPMMDGLPKGIDNRKTYCITKNYKGDYYAGTLSGLYSYIDNQWQTIEIPVKERKIVSIRNVDSSLYILTRSHILQIDSNNIISKIQLASPEDGNNKASMFKTLWMIHSGEILGLPGKLFVDLLGIIFIIISLTGILYFILPKFRKRLKNKNKNIKSLGSVIRSNNKWHNKLGYYFFWFLCILTFTGMFLRPPLLIAIANSKVPKIPFTKIDDPNPWFDKLRDFQIIEDTDEVILSTSDGFFITDINFDKKPIKLHDTPPVSVMGINVFKHLNRSQFLIGSFSGLYVWDAKNGIVLDAFTEEVHIPQKQSGPPISNNAISGFFTINDTTTYISDYNKGIYSMTMNNFPEMPQKILEKTPISLWNLSLEIHTGRIYRVFFGSLYILFIPITGILTLIVLISGWRMYRRIYNK
jgi:hypothetical protein